MESLFIPYGETPDFGKLDPRCRVVGINMSNPPWSDMVPKGVKLITTADVPREKLADITPTVEHGWGLIMAAHRRLTAAAEDAFGDRDDWTAPYQLRGCRILTIGYGRIGSAVARAALGFGMHVDIFERGDDEYHLHRCLLRANVVFVSCTLTNETFGLLGLPELECMLPTSILVSIAPWQVVQPWAVVHQLLDKRLRAAAFDDWPNDYDPTYVRHTGQLIITPHIGGSTLDARMRTEELVREEMDQWLRQQR